MNPVRYASKAGTTLLLSLILAGSAMAALTAKTSIVDPLHVALDTANAQRLIDVAGAANETPIRANSTVYTAGGTATGFTWGGYFSSASTGGNNGLRILDNNDLKSPAGSVGILLTYNYNPGQYWYTIFDSTGGNTPDQYVDLSGAKAAVSFYIASSAANTGVTKMRCILRANSGTQWYISDAFPIPALTNTGQNVLVPVKGVAWYAINSAVNGNLNLLAGNDDLALSWATTATATPNFSKVDGGGFFIDSGSDTTNISVKLGLPTWAAVNNNVAALGVACAPGYPKDAGTLVLTPGTQTAGTITLNAKSALSPLTITNLTVNGPAGEFSLSGLPSMPVTVDAANNLVVNVNWAPPATADNSDSSASLVVTCNAGYVPGTVITIPIRGRDVVSGSIYEEFNDSTAMSRAHPAYPNVTPGTMSPPSLGTGNTGFIWGAYSVATDTTGGRDIVGFAGNSTYGQRLAFYGATTNDSTAGGCWKGSYAYGLFDTMAGTGGNPAGLYIDRTINLHKFQFMADAIPAGCKVRWMVRDDTNAWFVSKTVTDMSALPTLQLNEIDTEAFSGWYTVDAAATTYMNSLVQARNTATPVAVTPMAEPTTLATGTPHMTKITGTGIYIEQGNTDPTATPLALMNLNLIAQPTNGDTLQVSSTLAVEPIRVPNRRLALKGLVFTEQGVESALDGLDVTVSPNTTGLQRLILMSDPNGNGLPDDGAELTNCALDANGTTAHLTFRTSQIFIKGSPVRMSLVGVFDDTASSKTYSISIAPAAFKQNIDNGGTDTIVCVPNPITASLRLDALAFPALDGLLEDKEFRETWEGVSAGLIPTTAASGPITGADEPWTYTWTGWSATGINFITSQFASKNGSMGLGNEVKDMTVEPNYDKGISYNSSLMYVDNFTPDATRAAKLEFDLTVTSTTFATSSARLSGRAVSDGSNVTVRLASLSNADAYNFTVYPLQDTSRYLFGINAVTGGVTYMSQFAPGNILAYSNAPGTGQYKFTVWLGQYSDTATIAKVDMRQVESGKTLSWTTVLDGKVPNLKNLRLAYGPYPDAFIDNIAVTTYVYYINPVRHWTAFE